MTRATPTPSRPPATVRIRLSVNDSRTSRQRDAPSASRTAVSCCRPDPLASARFARLLQATSSTAPTASMSTATMASTSVAVPVDSLTLTSAIGRACQRRLRSYGELSLGSIPRPSGNAESSCAASTLSSARASSIDLPDLRTPFASRYRDSRSFGSKARPGLRW